MLADIIYKNQDSPPFRDVSAPKSDVSDVQGVLLDKCPNRRSLLRHLSPTCPSPRAEVPQCNGRPAEIDFLIWGTLRLDTPHLSPACPSPGANVSQCNGRPAEIGFLVWGSLLLDTPHLSPTCPPPRADVSQCNGHPAEIGFLIWGSLRLHRPGSSPRVETGKDTHAHWNARRAPFGTMADAGAKTAKHDRQREREAAVNALNNVALALVGEPKVFSVGRCAQRGPFRGRVG